MKPGTPASGTALKCTLCKNIFFWSTYIIGLDNNNSRDFDSDGDIGLVFEIDHREFISLSPAADKQHKLNSSNKFTKQWSI